jgi:hypothetical protein
MGLGLPKPLQGCLAYFSTLKEFLKELNYVQWVQNV